MSSLDAVDEGVATIDQAAEFLQVSPRKVRMAIADRSLPSAKLGGSRRIPWRSLKAYIAERMVTAHE